MSFAPEVLSAVKRTSPPTYEDYTALVDRFSKKYQTLMELNLTGPGNQTSESFTFDEFRLVFLSLMTTRAQLKPFDPKKGLNQ